MNEHGIMYYDDAAAITLTIMLFVESRERIRRGDSEKAVKSTAEHSLESTVRSDFRRPLLGDDVENTVIDIVLRIECLCLVHPRMDECQSDPRQLRTITLHVRTHQPSSPNQAL